jgi:hypothetical protein
MSVFLLLFSIFADKILGNTQCCSTLSSFKFFRLRSYVYVVQPVLPETLAKHRINSLRVINRTQQSQCKRNNFWEELMTTTLLLEMLAEWKCAIYWRSSLQHSTILWRVTVSVLKFSNIRRFALRIYVNSFQSIKCFIGTHVSVHRSLILVPKYTNNVTQYIIVP